MAEKVDAANTFNALPDERYRNLNDLPPGELEAVRRVQKHYEDMSEQILSGEVTICERGPLELRPQCPEHLKKRHY